MGVVGVGALQIVWLANWEPFSWPQAHLYGVQCAPLAFINSPVSQFVRLSVFQSVSLVSECRSWHSANEKAVNHVWHSCLAFLSILMN